MSADLPVTNRIADRLDAAVTLFRGLRRNTGSSLDDFISAELAAIRLRHLRGLPPGYEFSRRLYRSSGVDPTRYRPSSEALWRRLRDRGDFPRVHPLVDLTNLLSLKHQVPYGLHDLARLRLPLELDIGREGEGYEGIRKETLRMTGKIVLRDAAGPVGNPSADSLRAAVSETTTEMLQVIYFHPGDDRRREILAETVALYARFFAAAAQSGFV